MPAKRIPELPTLTGAGSVAGDSLLIYDADLDTTKRITRAELALGIQQDLPALPVLGTMASQNDDAVAITGGTITGITDLAVADGGTGASDAATARVNLGAAARGANSDITSLSGLTTPLSIGQGGTGQTTASAARGALGAAASGANSDITSLTGLLTPLSVTQGGTGQTSLAGLASAMGVLAIVASSFTANGYVKFSNNFTLQWGKYQPGGQIGSNTYGVTFPIPFPTAVLNISVSTIATDGGDDMWAQVQKNTETTTGFTVRLQEEDGGNCDGFYWFAIGN